MCKERIARLSHRGGNGDLCQILTLGKNVIADLR